MPLLVPLSLASRRGSALPVAGNVLVSRMLKKLASPLV